MSAPTGPSDTDTGTPEAPRRRPVKPVRPQRPVKPAAPRPVPAKPVARKPVARKPVSPKPAAPEAVPARPVAPKPVAPKPVAPKAVTPKGAAPRAAEKPAEAPPGVVRRPDPLIGRTLGRCTIEALIGVGKTARVYRAHYEALDDTVAIKVLRTEVAQTPSLLARFQTEARSIAKVDNENVLKIYDVGEESGLHYMVVELLEGEEILELINREGQVDVMDALRIMRQAANGLAAAHDHGLVHRDIKPQNLFLLEDGTVKVVDFGLAARVDDDSERVGTPHYMAPEVCESGNAEFASDVYGLGIVLYHLLVGQPPYSGQDIQSILKSHIAAKPLRPERHRQGGLSKEVGELLRQLTKRDPLLRPTPHEMIAALDEIGGKELKQKETLKKRRGRSRARAAVIRRQKAGKKAPALAAIAVAAVLVVVVAIVVGSSDDEPARGPGMGGAAVPEARAPGPDPQPEGPDPVVETEAERRAREKRLADAAREDEARAALARVTTYAREHWHGPADTAAVRSKYIAVANKYRGTPAGKQAKLIADEIKLRKRHPHPDRKWSSEDAIQEAREQWARERPNVEKKIAAHAYTAAAALIPERISDESGRLAKELDFWREFLAHLGEYQRELVKIVTAGAPGDYVLETPDGEGDVKRMTSSRIEVVIGGETKAYSWSDIGAERLARLSQSVFSSEEDVRLLLFQMAFCWAHRLENAFWDVELELGATPGSGAVSREMKRYADSFKERIGK
jgi:tRNA A-37 threonylcarbamoyl transferase component Bud32